VTNILETSSFELLWHKGISSFGVRALIAQPQLK